MFWILAGIMAAVVAGAIWRRAADADGGADAGADAGAGQIADIRVYRAQMAALEGEIARGTLAAEDAGRLRHEIERRILEADRAVQDEAGARGAAAGRPAPAWVLPVALAAALVTAGGLYLRLGSAGRPDQPMAARLADADALRRGRPDQATAEAAARSEQPARPAPPADYLALVDQLRQAVSARPDDAEGHALLAATESALGNHAAARAAQDRVIALRGAAAGARDYAQRAEILISAAGGYVSPQAEADLAEALRRDPTDAPARYYSGLMLLQTGRADLAFGLWRKLLEEGPDDAPWIAPIRAEIESLAWVAGVANYTPPDRARPAGATGAASAGSAPAGTAGMSGMSGMDAMPGMAGMSGSTTGADAGTDAAAAAGATDAAAAAGATDAAGMGDAERDAMIRGMVDGLSARLFASGGSAEEWARLIRSESVLGNPDAAQAAYDAARAAHAGDGVALSGLAEAAVGAGLQP